MHRQLESEQNHVKNKTDICVEVDAYHNEVRQPGFGVAEFATKYQEYERSQTVEQQASEWADAVEFKLHFEWVVVVPEQVSEYLRDVL